MIESPLIARLEDVPFSSLHVKARIIVGSATFFDAFNALALAFALPVLIRLWNITPAQTGLLIGISYVGQFIGALLFSLIAEKFGRIRAAAAATALMSLMSLACAVAHSFPALMVYRVIQGVGVGGEMPVAATYISELSKARGRGKFFMLYEMLFPIGLMATSQIGAWVVPQWGWAAMFLIGGIPGIVISVLLLGLPESPRWLIANGRTKEAELIIKQIEASAKVVPMAYTGDYRLASNSGNPASWKEILGSACRERTLIVWALWATAYFVTNSLNNWMPSLYSTVYRLPLQQSLRAASMTNVAQVLILLICAFYIDRIGRRKWTVAGFIGGGASLAVLGLTGAAQDVTQVMILATFSYGLIGSINAVLYLYTPEIYPTRIRAIGTGLATSWLRLASAIGPTIVGFMVASKGVAAVFIMFALTCLVGLLAAVRMVETRSRRLEEIAQ
jgi:putative MFS transporter